MAFSGSNEGKIILFDVDGTLSPSRKTAPPEVLEFLAALRSKVTIGFVGGSDLKKQKEQLGDEVLTMFDYSFSENGLVAYKGEELIGKQSFSSFLGEEKLQELINWILAYLSQITLPVKRGTFIEFRAGMLNVSPIGRNCAQDERDAFEVYDQEHKIRSTMVTEMRERFADLNLTYSIGGQISFDVFPQGWDKTFCLQFLPEFSEIHFVGDKCFEGGNDYEIFMDDRTIGHSTTSPDATMAICKELFDL